MNQSSNLDLLFAPAEFAALPNRDLSQTVCVVFDILRATSTIITALANGAAAVIPVAEIAEALRLRDKDSTLLLAGEREGLRIRRAQTGSIDFDLGNSPREFTRANVAGKTIVTTTTNGTRALRSCAHAQSVLIGSFLGLRALGDWICARKPPRLLLICSGTIEEAAYEDTLAAGALCDLVWTRYRADAIADSAQIARQIYRSNADTLLNAMQYARNGRRLLQIPELRDDVTYCLQRDIVQLVAGLSPDGTIQPV